jgi:hypothetical protein
VKFGGDFGAELGFLADFFVEETLALLFEAEEFGLAFGAAADFGLFGGPSLPFETEPLRLEANAAELGELLGGADDGAALLGGVGGHEVAAEETAEGKDGGVDGAFGEREVAGGGFEFVGVLDELGHPGAGVFLAEPFLETTLAPFAEVLFADGASTEMGVEDVSDLGEAVEPGDEMGTDFAVSEAVVELVAECARETGDFAGAHRE